MPNDQTPNIKVLHVINGEHYAGAEKVQDLLALRLSQFGFDVGFACIKPRQFAQMRQSQDAPLYETAMHNRLDLRPAWQLARLVRQEGYELLHTHTPRTALIGQLAARLAGVPMVHHAHGQTAVEVDRHLWNRFNAMVERTSLRRAARVIAVSDSTVRYLQRQGIPDCQIAMIPNGVPSPAEMIPRETPQGDWTIGTVALFRPRKGTETLLEALALLRTNGLRVSLRAIGRFETDDYAAEVKNRVHELGLESAVHWSGFSKNVNRELEQIDLLVLPSLLAEGLPMVVVEAMAAGVPVVGSRVDGITDIIHHEEDGLLAAPGDPIDLASQLARVIRGQINWDELRQHAAVRHRECFSDDVMAQKVANTYREVLAT
jgi:glycosyltransferase involved in cell wall biosynthesis